VNLLGILNCRKSTGRGKLSDKEDEFSGELFKEQKSTNLCQYVYEDNVLINNHSLYKIHLMENNLWEDDQAVFLNKNLWHD